MPRDYDDEYVEFAGFALPELWRTAYLMCGDWHKAEDSAQEALLRLYRRWSKVERREGLLPYARRTLVRILIDESRRPWRREVATRTPPDRSVSGEAGAVDERLRLVEALGSVSPRRRACLVLRYYEDLSVREAAQVLGCSEGSVKSQTSRGLDDLRRVLGEGDAERMEPTVENTSGSQRTLREKGWA